MAAAAAAAPEAAPAPAPAPAPAQGPHPLQHKWVYWFDYPQKQPAGKEWTSTAKALATISTAEEFWRVHNNLPPPSDLKEHCDYHLFREGVKPQWEDKQNADGGRWVAELPLKELDQVNELWTDTLLAMVSDSFEFAEEINGAVLNVRKDKVRLALWTRSIDREGALLRTGKQWKDLLGLKKLIRFQPHSDSDAGRKLGKRLAAHLKL